MNKEELTKQLEEYTKELNQIPNSELMTAYSIEKIVDFVQRRQRLLESISKIREQLNMFKE
jgi:chorismate mutase